MQAGSDFLVLLDSKGHLYSMGMNESGQLGQDNKDPLSYPKLLAYFPSNNEKVVEYGVGFKHAIVLTNNAKVYSFGSNSAK